MRHFLLSAVTAAALLAPASAHADVVRDVTDGIERNVSAVWNFLGSHEVETGAKPAIAAMAPTPLAPREMTTLAVEVRAPEAPAVVLPTPKIETPLKRLFCVEYARMRSGLAVFGDAKFWWERAKNLYARAKSPVEEAVMVFSGSKRLKHGHLAVVTHVISPREIIVDQANWTNNGKIELASPVLDVSKDNDWSQVRVWNIATNSYGSRTYAISGFIVKPLERHARAN